MNRSKLSNIVKKKIKIINHKQTLKKCNNFIERMNNDIKRRSVKKIGVKNIK